MSSPIFQATLYDPLKVAEQIEKIVIKGILRKYYRTAWHERWYGGIASAYCCGCCLKCVFCFSGFPRDYPERIGDFYTPEHIFNELDACAKKFGYRQIRTTGNEPTIGREHLLRLLELVDQTDLIYILESNGILIGHDLGYAEQLSKFKNIHVRISFKGTNRQEFSLLTGADPEAFNLQLKALKNLLNAEVSCHPAVMLSFSPKENFEKLKDQLGTIDPTLARNVEEEYIILYPPVVERLKKAGIEPE